MKQYLIAFAILIVGAVTMLALDSIKKGWKIEQLELDMQQLKLDRQHDSAEREKDRALQREIEEFQKKQKPN